jgi:hypothetical protein
MHLSSCFGSESTIPLVAVIHNIFHGRSASIFIWLANRMSKTVLANGQPTPSAIFYSADFIGSIRQNRPA